MSVSLRVQRNCSDNFTNDKIFVDKLQEHKGYLLDCNYEEEQVNRAFFKAFRIKGIRHLKSNKKWTVRANQKLTLSQIMTRGFPISIGFLVNINISLRTTINVEFYFHRTVLGSHIGEDIGTLKNGWPLAMSDLRKSQVLVMMNPTQDAPGVVNVGKTPGERKSQWHL